jgi:hypothetical protein
VSEDPSCRPALRIGKSKREDTEALRKSVMDALRRIEHPGMGVLGRCLHTFQWGPLIEDLWTVAGTRQEAVDAALIALSKHFQLRRSPPLFERLWDVRGRWRARSPRAHEEGVCLLLGADVSFRPDVIDEVFDWCLAGSMHLALRDMVRKWHCPSAKALARVDADPRFAEHRQAFLLMARQLGAIRAQGDPAADALESCAHEVRAALVDVSPDLAIKAYGFVGSRKWKKLIELVVNADGGISIRGESQRRAISPIVTLAIEQPSERTLFSALVGSHKKFAAAGVAVNVPWLLGRLLGIRRVLDQEEVDQIFSISVWDKYPEAIAALLKTSYWPSHHVVLQTLDRLDRERVRGNDNRRRAFDLFFPHWQSHCQLVRMNEARPEGASERPRRLMGL